MFDSFQRRDHVLLAGLLVVCLLVTILIGAAPPPRAKESRLIEAAVRVAPTTETPATATFEPSPTVRELLKQVAAGNKDGRTVRLTIVKARPPVGADVMLRVFVNDDTASAKTLPKGPHFAGTVSFFPRTEKPETSSFLLNIGGAIEQLGKAGQFDSRKPLRVRIVVVPSGQADKTMKVEVAVEKLTLEVVD